MDLARHVIRRAGDYGKGLNPITALRGLPALLEAAKRKWAIIPEADEERLFATRQLHALIKSAGGDQATACTPGVPKRGRPDDRLRPGVDRLLNAIAIEIAR